MPLTQGMTDRFLHAESGTESTKQPILDIKRITRGKFTADEKIRIVLEGSRETLQLYIFASGKVSNLAPTILG